MIDSFANTDVDYIIINAAGCGHILKEYNLAKNVTRQRLYIDAIESVMTSTNKVLVDNKANNSLLYLPIDKMISNNSRTTLPTVESTNSSGSSQMNSNKSKFSHVGISFD